MYYVNEKGIDTESLNLQYTSPIIPDKSTYTHSTSISIPNTVNLVISPNETPITTKSINPSLDHQKTYKMLVIQLMPELTIQCRNDSNKVFCGRSNIHAHKKVRWKSNFIDRRNKALINNLTDQIEMPKKWTP